MGRFQWGVISMITHGWNCPPGCSTSNWECHRKGKLSLQAIACKGCKPLLRHRGKTGRRLHYSTKVNPEWPIAWSVRSHFALANSIGCQIKERRGNSNGFENAQTQIREQKERFDPWFDVWQQTTTQQKLLRHSNGPRCKNWPRKNTCLVV